MTDTPIPVLDEKVAPRLINAQQEVTNTIDQIRRDMNPSDRGLAAKIDYAIRELQAARKVLNA